MFLKTVYFQVLVAEINGLKDCEKLTDDTGHDWWTNMSNEGCVNHIVSNLKVEVDKLWSGNKVRVKGQWYENSLGRWVTKESGNKCIHSGLAKKWSKCSI